MRTPRFKEGDKVYLVRHNFLKIVKVKHVDNRVNECEPIVYWIEDAPVAYSAEDGLYATSDCAIEALSVMNKSFDKKGHLCVPYWHMEKELSLIRQKDKSISDE